MDTPGIINFVLREENLKSADFAKSIGVTSTQIYDLLSGKTKKISSKNADKIILVFPKYSKSWLMTGMGNPFIQKENEVNPRLIEFMLFPIVTQKAYAGYLSGYADTEYIESLPTVAFPVDHTPLGNYLVFEVKGESMYDGSAESYLPGDLLLCREVKMDLWKDSKLHFNKWDFVIVHKTDGVLIKRIINHDVEKHTITIHSLNPAYPDTDIDLADVKQILNVVSMMRPRKR